MYGFDRTAFDEGPVERRAGNSARPGHEVLVRWSCAGWIGLERIAESPVPDAAGGHWPATRMDAGPGEESLPRALRAGYWFAGRHRVANGHQSCAWRARTDDADVARSDRHRGRAARCPECDQGLQRHVHEDRAHQREAAKAGNGDEAPRAALQ